MKTARMPEKIGRYQILERVGRGGMGVLYRGFDPVLDREVAIKVMLTDFSDDAEQMRPRFYREAKAAAKLQHRNIVTVFEFAEEGNQPHIVMEFLRGTPLGVRMAAQPPLTLDDKLDTVAQLCSGLGYAHSQGVVHRDVKPANVFLLEDGTVKLLDFGIAKLTTSTLTRQGDVLGSASYMSPEQVAGSESVDGRADIWSTGVVLYELLAGRKPFEGDSPTAVIVKILKEEPPPIETLVPGLPAQLVAAVKRALQKDSASRFVKADELARELQWIRKALQASGELAQMEETRFASTRVLKALHEDIQKLQTGPVTASTGTVATSASSDAAASEARAATAAPTPKKWLVPVGVGAGVLAAIIAGVTMIPRGNPPDAGAQPVATTATAPTTPGGASSPPAITPVASSNAQPSGAPANAPAPEAASRAPAVVAAGGAGVNAPANATSATAKPAADTREARGRATLPPPAVASVSVSLSGAYPFEVFDGSRSISAPSASHDLTVASGRSLRLVAPEYFLNQTVRVEGGPGRPFEHATPGLGRLTVRSNQETCTVKIGNRDLGFPPVNNLQVAAGNYQIEQTCPSGQSLRTFATVNPGQTIIATLR